MNASGIYLVIMLAIVVEALVEYGKSISVMFTKRQYKTAITQLAAMLCAVMLCLLTGADLFSAVGLTFSLPWAGSVLTSIFASRGSNYVSDIAGSLRKATKTE